MQSRPRILLLIAMWMTACRSGEVASEAPRSDGEADVSAADVVDSALSDSDDSAENAVVIETGDGAAASDAADAFDAAICGLLAAAECVASGCQEIRCRRIDRARGCKATMLNVVGCRSKGSVVTGSDCFAEIATGDVWACEDTPSEARFRYPCDPAEKSDYFKGMMNPCTAP